MRESETPIYVVGLNVIDELADEFNAWYDNEHLPEVMRADPDITSATRYRIAGGNLPYSYFAIYRFESTDGLNRFMNNPRLKSMIADFDNRWASVTNRARAAYSPILNVNRNELEMP